MFNIDLMLEKTTSIEVSFGEMIGFSEDVADLDFIADMLSEKDAELAVMAKKLRNVAKDVLTIQSRIEDRFNGEEEL